MAKKSESAARAAVKRKKSSKALMRSASGRTQTSQAMIASRTTTVTQHLARVLRQLRRRKVRVPESKPVLAYLGRYSELSDLLLPIVALVEAKFPKAQLSLEVYSDAEEAGLSWLILYVRMREYERGFLRALEDLTQAYAPMLAGKEGQLLVTSDFRPPRG
ncbi:MAG: hypothetical protein RMJ19_02875 [Gemmatales bacterium]|nr:hypothetical protein [Gemmatales bacterium]MCS7159392.1 hypothetical protein [Gemmatales bacterium]MDW8174591.1 hypothetical protein [Gemmatales bacterium]MDW8222223.1 hypothetical protein [Gemmatales bacterium]